MNFIAKFEKNKGITLIALVVTIIVLLILAGISITMLTGQNGVLKRAVEAKSRQHASSIAEVIKLEMLSIESRKSKGESIDDIEKINAIYNKIEESNLTGGTKKIGNLIVVEDKYVISMSTGEEAIQASPDEWNYYVWDNWKGYDDSEYLDWAFITGYKGNKKNITIPEYVIQNKKICPIREIRQNWNGDFEKCQNVESIKILENIIKIEQTEFASMANLKKVEIADTVTDIGNNVFSCDYKLESVKLPARLSAIKSSTFYCCYALKNVEIPKNVQSIETNAFALCLSIEKIEIPASVKSIGKCAFGYMGIDDSDSENSSENSGDYIHNELGYTKGNLKMVILNEGIETIEDNAFTISATAENKLKLPKSLKTIGSNAFKNFGSIGGGKVYNSDGTIYDVK